MADHFNILDQPDSINEVIVIDAGSNLSTARPTSAGAVYWIFNNGVDVGADGVNVVNGSDGDLFFVRGA